MRDSDGNTNRSIPVPYARCLRSKLPRPFFFARPTRSHLQTRKLRRPPVRQSASRARAGAYPRASCFYPTGRLSKIFARSPHPAPRPPTPSLTVQKKAGTKKKEEDEGWAQRSTKWRPRTVGTLIDDARTQKMHIAPGRQRPRRPARQSCETAHERTSPMRSAVLAAATAATAVTAAAETNGSKSPPTPGTRQRRRRMSQRR